MAAALRVQGMRAGHRAVSTVAVLSMACLCTVLRTSCACDASTVRDLFGLGAWRRTGSGSPTAHGSVHARTAHGTMEHHGTVAAVLRAPARSVRFCHARRV